jgi:hypothetical protein
VSGVDAVAAAAGGTLCFRARRLPHDFAAAAKRLRDTDDVMLVICGDGAYPRDLLLVRPAPICVPAVARRASDLSRIIDEYARDAVAELAAGRTELTNADQSWVRQYAAASLGEVEKATLRLVAIRTSRNVSAAAARLGMAPVSLAKWLGRRQPLPAVRREP